MMRRAPSSSLSLLGRWWRRRQRAKVSVASAVGMFAVSGFIALAVVAGAVVEYVRRSATDEAIRDARRISEVVAWNVVAPNLDASLPQGDSAALQQFDLAIRQQVLGASIVRVKLWTPDGRIVYSDEPRLIGRRFALGEEELEAMAGGATEAEISDLDRPENMFERPWQKLLEVYLPVRTRAGETLLFEAYLPYASITESSREIWMEFLPALLAGLVVLALVQLPLAWSLARNLRRGQDERESLLKRAVEASDRERRLIAGELHDGAVQDLVGQAFRLSAAADSLRDSAPERTVTELRNAAARTRATVQTLRSLVVELYPPNLHSAGLEAALTDLVGSLRDRGMAVELAVEAGPRIPPHVERLLYRVARETLRNVQQHAAASRVRLCLTSTSDGWRLSVDDDGGRYSTLVRNERRARGHVGLDLVEELVRDAGGRFSIGPTPSGHTVAAAEVPAW